jgi:PIN domain nuclease of toxin-antitoxin system
MEFPILTASPGLPPETSTQAQMCRWHFALGKRTRLGSKARRLFIQADDGKCLIYVPVIVLWEAAVLAGRGYIKIPQRFDHWCRAVENGPGFAIAALDWLDVDEARKLPFADPYDCLITATALRHGMPLITGDHAIAESGLVETIW